MSIPSNFVSVAPNIYARSIKLQGPYFIHDPVQHGGFKMLCIEKAGVFYVCNSLKITGNGTYLQHTRYIGNGLIKELLEEAPNHV